MVIFRSRWLSCLRCCLKACCLLNSVRRTKDHDASSIWMAKGEFLLKKMKCWNEYCSWNFENKMLLLEAEWLSITGDFDQAESLYVRSIATSCSVFTDTTSLSACNSITSNCFAEAKQFSCLHFCPSRQISSSRACLISLLHWGAAGNSSCCSSELARAEDDWVTVSLWLPFSWLHPCTMDSLLMHFNNLKRCVTINPCVTFPTHQMTKNSTDDEISLPLATPWFASKSSSRFPFACIDKYSMDTSIGIRYRER